MTIAVVSTIKTKIENSIEWIKIFQAINDLFLLKMEIFLGYFLYIPMGILTFFNLD